ncbi:MAG: hypothetical protein L3V56_13205, partial [Candidatus Magnetoovum sp. WYHC-5]|nr:hypothetical protein [Candidatus Magnetoovum sp. WYHC-5]
MFIEKTQYLKGKNLFRFINDRATPQGRTITIDDRALLSSLRQYKALCKSATKISSCSFIYLMAYSEAATSGT